MANIKILLTSVLKPVDDTRMYEKIGLALTKIENAEIHIAGFMSDAIQDNGPVNFHPLFDFQRLNLKRMFAGLKIWRLQLKVKPEVIICNTHELLIVTIAYKILFGCRVIYDIQENYFKNLWYGKQFAPVLKHVLALITRLKERMCCPFFDSILLAEKCYLREMPFLNSHNTILIENKFKKPADFNIPTSPGKLPLRMLYSGTISDTYGIFEALELALGLLALQEGKFTIIGHCPDRSLLKKVEKAISPDNRIILIGGDKPIPHKVIFQHIAESNLGILGYKENPAISGRIPTRLYEYMGFKLPFVYPAGFKWDNLVEKYRAGIPVNLDAIDAAGIIESYLSTDFYPTPFTDEIFFDHEEKKLSETINSLI